MKKIIFVTGTDTGVGKTLLSALLLFHLRKKGIHALAMKPFCSGGRADIRRLQALQPGELPDEQMNPFYYEQPLAPYVAAKSGQHIRLCNAVERIMDIAKKSDQLVVEGSGGLLVPLGADFTVAELIAALDCRVIITSRNRLGTINHTLLTVNALRSLGISQAAMAVLLMAQRKPDLSAQTNPRMLAKLLHPVRVQSLPFLGSNPHLAGNIRANYPRLRSVLDSLAHATRRISAQKHAKTLANTRVYGTL